MRLNQSSETKPVQVHLLWRIICLDVSTRYNFEKWSSKITNSKSTLPTSKSLISASLSKSRKFQKSKLSQRRNPFVNPLVRSISWQPLQNNTQHSVKNKPFILSGYIWAHRKYFCNSSADGAFNFLTKDESLHFDWILVTLGLLWWLTESRTQQQ